MTRAASEHASERVVRISAVGILPVDPARAWARLVDWDRQAEWIVDADDVRVVGRQREGVGVRVAVRTRVLNVPLFTEVLEVLRWEPPTLLQVVHTGVVAGAAEWRLEPVDDAATRFVWREDLRFRSRAPALGELALRVYAPVLRRLMRRSIAVLAASLGTAGR